MNEVVACVPCAGPGCPACEGAGMVMRSTRPLRPDEREAMLALAEVAQARVDAALAGDT